MLDWICRLVSDDKGNPSSSRVISLYLTLWGTVQISVCSILGIDSLLTGTELSALLMASYGATAMKKPFENGNNPYKPNSKPKPTTKPNSKLTTNNKYGGTSYYDDNSK